MEVKIVLGYAFGDEGKGVTVQWLCKKAIEEGKRPLVIRFSGGPQAAHTVNNGGIEHICSSFGSGVLLGVPTYLNHNVYVDPISLVKELEVLNSKGTKPNICASWMCKVITPYDVLAGQKNAKVLSDGTCGKGIYSTFDRYKSSEKVQPQFFINYQDESGPEYHLHMASQYHNLERIDDYDNMYKSAIEKLRPYITHQGMLDKNLENYDVLIFEGSQGLLLDMACGFYPHVTPSRTGLNGIDAKYLHNAEVYLVTRTYTTRHGNGYEPKHKLDWDLSVKHETNVHNEFQGDFKVGALEVDLLNRAGERHRLDNYKAEFNLKYNLVITHMDLPIRYWNFECHNGDRYNHWIGGGLTPQKVAQFITNFLDIPMDRVYYNDSIESNIKEV